MVLFKINIFFCFPLVHGVGCALYNIEKKKTTTQCCYIVAFHAELIFSYLRQFSVRLLHSPVSDYKGKKHSKKCVLNGYNK